MNPIELLVETLNKKEIWSSEEIVDRGTFLCAPGNINTKLYFVLEGSLRAYILDDLEEEQTIRFAYKNSIFAGLDSFMTGKPSNFYIQTIKRSRIQWIEKSELIQLANESNDFMKLWLSILESFVVQQMEREEDLLINSPLIRYKRVLKRSPKVFQEIPHKYIASYLRMTPETFSRIKKS